MSIICIPSSNPELIVSWNRFAKMVYDKESKVIIKRLWDETMMEFEFAHALQILESL